MAPALNLSSRVNSSVHLISSTKTWGSRKRKNGKECRVSLLLSWRLIKIGWFMKRFRRISLPKSDSYWKITSSTPPLSTNKTAYPGLMNRTKCFNTRIVQQTTRSHTKQCTGTNALVRQILRTPKPTDAPRFYLKDSSKQIAGDKTEPTPKGYSFLE